MDSSKSTSTSASPIRSKILSEQHHQLTEQLIRLKFEIAEQKGKHDQLQFDWQKLNTEKHSIHEDILTIEKECKSIRDETGRIRVEKMQTRQRLDKIVAQNESVRRVADEAKAERDKAQSALHTKKDELKLVKTAGEEMQRTILTLRENAAVISSDRAKLSSQNDGVIAEIETLKKHILDMRISVQSTKDKSEKYGKDLIETQKESELLAKQNDILESKIAAREDHLEKHKL